MRITVIMIGKTDFSYLREGMQVYEMRLKRYIRFEVKTIPDLRKKSLSMELQRKAEGENILREIADTDFVICLDEKGSELSSVNFARFLQQKMLLSIHNLVFIIGGAYGFSEDVYKRSDKLLSLSKMTFSHQMVRLIFYEQLYRAFSIIKGEPYHH